MALQQRAAGSALVATSVEPPFVDVLLWELGDQMEPPLLTTASATYVPARAYVAVRDQILLLPKDSAVVGEGGTVAALMESGHRSAVATLAAIADRTTSLYFSTGGGIIGAGRHKAVAIASADFLKAAGQCIGLMQEASTFPLPRPKHVRFYVVSRAGIWTAEVEQEQLGQNLHPLSPLFFLSHAVITAVREHSPPPR